MPTLGGILVNLPLDDRVLMSLAICSVVYFEIGHTCTHTAAVGLITAVSSNPASLFGRVSYRLASTS